MAKYTKELLEKICSLIKEDSFTIAEICINVGISERSFYDWQTKYAEFADSIKRAREDFNSLLIVECKKSLIKKIRGYTIQEKKTITADTGKLTEDGKPIVKVKEHSVTDKHFQPDTAAIIFTLCNRDPDNWKNRQENNITGDMTLKSELEKRSDEELENIIKNGEK